MGRAALIVAHTSRDLITRKAAFAVHELIRAGFEVRMLEQEARECCITDVVTVAADPSAAENAELVLVLGGDGTFLRAAELARPARVPMLGVNLGHVGFLAGAEPDALAEALTAVVDRRYDVEERVTLDVRAELDGRTLATEWALNEASVEKTARERMLELAVAVDGRPLLRFGCDGVLCATPTGSTAYAFSAGGADRLADVWMRCSWYPTRRMRCSRGPWWWRPSSVDVTCSAPTTRRAELRRPPRDRRAARRPGDGSPRSHAGPDRAAGGLELRRPSGHQVPAAGVRLPRRPRRTWT